MGVFQILSGGNTTNPTGSGCDDAIEFLAHCAPATSAIARRAAVRPPVSMARFVFMRAFGPCARGDTSSFFLGI